MATLTITAVDTATDQFTTATPHNLSSGNDVKLVATTAPGGLVNGTIYYARVIDSTNFKVHPATAVALTITAATCTANVATLTFAAQASAPFAVGSTIRVQGITGQTSYNGSFTVTGCTTTTVTYALPTVAAGTASADSTVRAHTRSMAKTGFGTIDITSAGTNVTFQTSEVKLENFTLLESETFGTPETALSVTAMPFADYRMEPRYVATTSVNGAAQIDSDYAPILGVPATSLSITAMPFADYRMEPRYVATTSVNGQAQTKTDWLTTQVSAVGLTTSPTYVYTDGAPKAAPGPAIVTEVWYLS